MPYKKKCKNSQAVKKLRPLKHLGEKSCEINILCLWLAATFYLTTFLTQTFLGRNFFYSMVVFA